MEKTGTWNGFDLHEFSHEDYSCRIVAPKVTASGKPWVWRAVYWGHEPQTEIALLEKGYHIAFIECSDLLGSSKMIEERNSFYQYVTKNLSFSRKPVLLGMSRGGLCSLRWAIANPDKVSCLYIDAPVCDFKSWPGGQGKSPKSPDDWQQVLEVYHLSEEESTAYKGNPIDSLEPLAERKIPILCVCGDSDTVVPYDENGGLLLSRYQALGAPIEVILKQGGGHHPHSLENPQPIVDFILRNTMVDELWKLSGTGQLIPPGMMQVTGDGTNVSTWQTEPVRLQPGAFYRFTVSYNGVEIDGGNLPCGIEGFTRDYRALPNQWDTEWFCFRLQDNVTASPMRVGQRHSQGSFQFHHAQLESVARISKEFDFPFGTLLLGEGESVHNGKYSFHSCFDGKNTNAQNPLVYSDATFHTDHLCFKGPSQVMYRLALPMDDQNAIPLESVKFRVHVRQYTQGEGIVEIGLEGPQNQMIPLGKFAATGTHEFELPHHLFPLNVLTVRVVGSENSDFQIDHIGFEAGLPRSFKNVGLDDVNITGETRFATLDEGPASKTDVLSLTPNNAIRIRKRDDDFTIPEERIFPIQDSRSPGEMIQQFDFDGRKYTLTTVVHHLHRSDYGYMLPTNQTASPTQSWWCEADWKVSRDRRPPVTGPETIKPIEIRAAKNDVEGFQFVVRAHDDVPITGLTGIVDALQGPNGAVIPVENIELLYAYYHFVHSKTDASGIVDHWPDALPPLDRPINIEPGKNQPLWVNVKVPFDAVAGDYEGTFRLESQDGHFHMTVPYRLHVWDFALPKENHLETSYGFASSRVFTYHNAQTQEDQRRIHEMYLQCFADHRVSIYNPVPFENMSVQWLPNENPPRCDVDFSRYEAEMERVIEKYHFTNFTVPGHGLGSGTFQSRTEPSLVGFGENTPEYEAMMTDYYQKLQEFLVKKGWINKAYIYWFDEPGHHDYEFVAEGTAKIKKYGPLIQRFMTLMMNNDDFMKALDAKNTSINIWCSITNHFNGELAKERMPLGERFWWYVCTAPKSPYCTLFIDHPATDLRIWHWQTWQNNVAGTLVWESVYWHSATAYPDSFQNPYEDPMGFASGYSLPSGTKQHWGNGDGRLFYPPLNAAVPDLNDRHPVLDKPVSSIRGEMIREGIEDYEMLYMLRALIHEKSDRFSAADCKAAMELLEVPESITKSMTEFTMDPRPVLQRRVAIAEMIEKWVTR